MKAIVYTSYGSPDVLKLQDVDDPVARANEVLVRVRAASVNPYDWHFLRGMPYAFVRPLRGLRRPKVTSLGYDLAGQVESVGSDVTRFRPGDEVFGRVRELPGTNDGSFAEYACASQDHLVLKPASLTVEQAAALPLAGLTALQGLRDVGQLTAGQRVLINGAAGGIGTFAVQIATALGAEVTGVCSTRNVKLVKSLGASHVIDYTRKDFTQHSQPYPLLFDLVGNRSMSAYRHALEPGGRFVTVGGGGTGRWFSPVPWILGAKARSFFADYRFSLVNMQLKVEDLNTLTRLIEDGSITPVIDRQYPLREVPEAIRYLEEGHARGKVLITV